jgi:O-antigen/teichoic acid export membrane protein
MSSFLKDFLSVGISQGLSILFGLAVSIITARYIGPEGNGIIAGLSVYPSLFMTIGSLGIRQATTYFLGKSVFSENQIKTAITQIWLLTTVISLSVSYWLIRNLSSGGYDLEMVIIALLPIPFSLFNTYNSGIFLGKNDIKSYNRINWIPSFIVLLGSVLLVICFDLDAKGALLAVVGGHLFVFLLLMRKNDFLNFFSINYEWKVIKSMLSLGLVYAFSLLIINLNYKVDLILLDKLSTPYELGIYSKGAGITQYIWQIPMLLSTIVFARSTIAKDDISFSLKVAQLLRVSFAFVAVAGATLFVFSSWIIELMYGSEFLPSAIVLQWLLPGVIVMTVFKVMNMDLAGKGKPWVALWAMSPALLVNVALNILFIPMIGAKGAALASSVSYGLAGLLFLHFYSREAGVSVVRILSFSARDFDFLMRTKYK